MVENIQTIEVSDALYKKLKREGSPEYYELCDKMDAETDWADHFDSKDVELEIEVIG